MREPLNRTIPSEIREQIVLATALHVADRVSLFESGSAQCGRVAAEAVLAAIRTLVEGFNESAEPPSRTAPDKYA